MKPSLQKPVQIEPKKHNTLGSTGDQSIKSLISLDRFEASFLLEIRIKNKTVSSFLDQNNESDDDDPSSESKSAKKIKGATTD